jgi:hypothetical protein
MNNNPMQLFYMLTQNPNPMGMMSQLMGGNPFFQQAMKMAEGKNPNEIKQIVNNIASQKGITQEQLNGMFSMFGFKF